MKKQVITAPSVKVPTANIAVNKSRIKIYKKENDLPTYYLQKGQEFQIELFNPTTDVVLAKITLNGKSISQGGLVLNPGQRVFLDRYLDVAKKFLFDTYEVSNTKETKEAIADNGDFKVEFFRESKPTYRYYPQTILGGSFGGPMPNSGGYVRSSSTAPNTPLCDTFTTSSMTYYNSDIINCSASSTVTFDGVGEVSFSTRKEPIKTGVLRSLPLKSKKSIETGRVEEGSYSDQKFKTVNKEFDWFAFHTVSAKLLPVSQKINTSEDINVKRYCTNCGAKSSKTDNFCSKCGKKL